MFQNLLLSAAQEVRGSSSCVTPCVVMKNDGFLYHQESSFSPERWTKVVLQECAVIAFTVCLGSTAWLMTYATMNVTFTAHCIGRTFLDEENQDVSTYLSGVSSLVCMSEPSVRP